MGHLDLYLSTHKAGRVSPGERLGKQLAEAVISLSSSYYALRETERETGFEKIETLEKRINDLLEPERAKALEIFLQLTKGRGIQ